MRERKNPAIVAEWAQQKAIEQLRNSLASNGYLTFPISPKWRRHKLDFVAVLKEPPMNFLVVRPTLKGRISLTPYGPRSQYVYAQRAVTQACQNIDVIVGWSKRQLRKPPEGPWWETYLPLYAQRELRLLLHIEE